MAYSTLLSTLITSHPSRGRKRGKLLFAVFLVITSHPSRGRKLATFGNNAGKLVITSLRLAVPEKPFALTLCSGFSTAAEIAFRLPLPPAAAERDSPHGAARASAAGGRKSKPEQGQRSESANEVPRDPGTATRAETGSDSHPSRGRKRGTQKINTTSL